MATRPLLAVWPYPYGQKWPGGHVPMANSGRVAMWSGFVLEIQVNTWDFAWTPIWPQGEKVAMWVVMRLVLVEDSAQPGGGWRNAGGVCQVILVAALPRYGPVVIWVRPIHFSVNSTMPVGVAKTK